MKQFLRPTLTAAAMAVALGMTASVYAQAAKPGAAATGSVDKAKVSYIVGYQIAQQIPPIMRSELDAAAVSRAVQAALSGQKPTITDDEAKQVMQPFMAKMQAKQQVEVERIGAKNKAEGDAFLAKNKSAPGVKTTASGLQYQVITQGTGARPGPSDTVQIDYTGSLIDGEVFDASAKHNPPGPASIPIGGVIPGFKEGLQLMQVGGHYKLYIPSSLAYGVQPPPQSGLAPNSTLIFDVTLVKTAPTPAGAGPGGAGPGPGGQ